MMIWPELRAAYLIETGGKSLAKASLEDFVGYVIYYSISSPDGAAQKRKALFSALKDELVEGAEFDEQAVSLSGELEALEKRLREGIE